MPRRARVVIPDVPLHVTQRGNRREVEDAPWRDVFFSDQDRLRLLRLLASCPAATGLEVNAYCPCGLGRDPLLSGGLELADHVGDWATWLADGDDEQALVALRQATRTGRPAGDKAFVQRLERLCGRTLRAKPRGRPRKPKPRAQQHPPEHP